VRNEIDQNAVKQIDVIRSQLCGPLQEQFGDPAGCLGATLGIATFDNFIEPGDQRRGGCHQTHSNSRQTQANFKQTSSRRRFFVNLGGLGEGRVRFENRHRTGRKIALARGPGPCRIGQKPLYQRQLLVSHTIAY
jgi:hypothetical protein